MPNVIAIDLGGTKLSAALLDEAGGVVLTHTEATAQAGRSALLAQLAAVVKRLGQGQEVLAVGLGSPGFIDSERGVVIMATNLVDWSQTAVKDKLQQITGLPVAVMNDANAAALGEAWLGAGRGSESFVMLTLGTGVGGAIYHRQTGVWPGCNHRGGEFGHSILYPGGRPCPCGQFGCVDQYLSGRAIQAAYQVLTGQDCTCEQIFQEAAVGQSPATRIIREFARDLATHLISLQNIIDPEVFILGGGLSTAHSVWGELLNQQLLQLTGPGSVIRWRLAETGTLAGLLGAGKLAWDLVERNRA